MVLNASIENNSSGSNESSPGRAVPDEQGFIGSGDPNHFNAGLEHINQAQSALQNGDTEGAINHLELAKQSFQTYCECDMKPVSSDIAIR
ncbi:MAG: hypothetical protein ACRD8W_31490, partial [Nitrososphaeraceae archaeon]